MKLKAELEKKIEALRQQMYDVFQTSTDEDEIIRISQRLDDALNDYERLK